MELVISELAVASAQSCGERVERNSAAFSNCGGGSSVSFRHRSSAGVYSAGVVDLHIRALTRTTSFDGIRSNPKLVLVAHASLEQSRTDECPTSRDGTESSTTGLSTENLGSSAGGLNHDEVYSPGWDSGPGEGPGGGNGDGGGRQYGGGDGGGEGSGKSDEDEEYGPLLNAEQVQRELDARGVTLPPDMLEAVRGVGIRKVLLQRCFELQAAPWPLGSAFVSSKLLRNRMLADPKFLFKLSAEIAIASACATVAEIKKRGEHFWNEFELYASDMLVGIAFDIVLVGLMAPYVGFGAPLPKGSDTRDRLFRLLQALPSNVLEAQKPGRTFTPLQRISTLFYKGVQYGVAGFGCGILGQGVASSVMAVKRKLRKRKAGDTEDEVEVPDVVRSAAVWSLFMATSANVRYQLVTGLESAVERSVIGKRVPQAAMLFTVGIRLANNVYGSMQFVDWARWAGVQ